jgi:hypothetical protein
MKEGGRRKEEDRILVQPVSIKDTPAVFVKRSFVPGVSLFIAGFLWDHT